MTPPTLSKALKKHRLQANLSQTVLAANLGVTLSAIGRGFNANGQLDDYTIPSTQKEGDGGVSRLVLD